MHIKRWVGRSHVGRGYGWRKWSWPGWNNIESRSPLIFVIQVQFQALESHTGWLCSWFSFIALRMFLRVPTTNQTLQISTWNGGIKREKHSMDALLRTSSVFHFSQHDSRETGWSWRTKIPVLTYLTIAHTSPHRFRRQAVAVRYSVGFSR